MICITESKLIFLHLERDRKIKTDHVDKSTNLKPIPIIFHCFFSRFNYITFQSAVKAFGRILLQKNSTKDKKGKLPFLEARLIRFF
jgi:hypothetical protein